MAISDLKTEIAQRVRAVLLWVYFRLQDYLEIEPVTIEVPVVSVVGPKRPNAKKLTRREVAEIREMNRAGFSQATIAEVYDLNPATVSRIIRGIYYKGAAA